MQRRKKRRKRREKKITIRWHWNCKKNPHDAWKQEQERWKTHSDESSIGILGNQLVNEIFLRKYFSKMSVRLILIGLLIFATLVIPLVQLSIGFHYVDKPESCPIKQDIPLLMAIGGFFQIIFFAVAFAFIFNVTPDKYKKQKNQTAAQKSAKGSNRASKILIGKILSNSLFSYLHTWDFLIGCITGILGACAIIFFILLQFRVYRIFQEVQWTTNDGKTYCVFTIYSGAFGLIIATYVAFILLLTVGIILICGVGARKP